MSTVCRLPADKLEEVSVDDTFEGWLYWDLRSPSGATLMASYFEGHHEGRRVLSETGTYTLRVRVLANNPEYVGEYAFQVRGVPADEVFGIQIGDLVSDGAPSAGAGRIEVPGAYDIYEFPVVAGQNAWFEDLSADPDFQGYLQWELKAPSGKSVFRTYLGGGQEGRKTLDETGTYRLTIFSGLNEINNVGPYSFRIRNIPPDQHFPIQIGDTVTNGVPSAGAGHIEVAGVVDLYTFEGTAGQNVFFDSLFAEPSLGGYLRWEAKTPSGQSLFSSYLSSGSSVGRKTLPETGTYSIRLSVIANDPALIGKYSFRLLNIDDSGIALQLGQAVSPGVPATGAGQIENAGGQDIYTFNGIANQSIVLEEISAAASFAGYLRWELLDPANRRVIIEYLVGQETNYIKLPEAGKYTIKIYAGANNSAYVGNYSFRVYSEVHAASDQFGMSPTDTLVIPKTSLLCNDHGTSGEQLLITLTNSTTWNGGTVVETTDFITYTPPPTFTGNDSFVYRLQGELGGEDFASISVQVNEEAEDFASVVSFKSTSPLLVDVCLFGTSGGVYAVQTSPDLEQWSNEDTNLTADDRGAFNFTYVPAPGEDRRFYRFRKVP